MNRLGSPPLLRALTLAFCVRAFYHRSLAATNLVIKLVGTSLFLPHDIGSHGDILCNSGNFPSDIHIVFNSIIFRNNIIYC